MQTIYQKKIKKFQSIEKELVQEVEATNKPANISQLKYLNRIRKLIMFYQNRYVTSN